MWQAVGKAVSIGLNDISLMPHFSRLGRGPHTGRLIQVEVLSESHDIVIFFIGKRKTLSP